MGYEKGKIITTKQYAFDTEYSTAYFVGYRLFNDGESVALYIRDTNGYDWGMPKGGAKFNYSRNVRIQHIKDNKVGWKNTYDYLVKNQIIKEDSNMKVLLSKKQELLKKIDLLFYSPDGKKLKLTGKSREDKIDEYRKEINLIDDKINEFIGEE